MTPGELGQWLDAWLQAFPALVCVYVMLGAAIFVVRDELWPGPARTGEEPWVAVLVPARNEETALGDCLEALLRCNYRRLEVHVLSDGSRDRTAEIARGFAGRGVRLWEFPESLGKGAVLQAALGALTSELVMVVDADTIVEPGAIREMARAFGEPRIGGATANIRVRNARGVLALLEAIEYASIIGLLKRANSAWGGLFTVSGAACCFRTDAVRRVGGFASCSVTEDIELSWRLQKAGWKLVYVPDALVQVSVPRSLPGLWRQRARWSQGLTEVLRLHGAVWRSQRRGLVAFALEALLGMGWVALLTLSLCQAAAQLLIDPAGFRWPELGLGAALSMTLFLCQTLTAAIFDSHTARVPWRALPLAVLYPLYFAVVVMPSGLLGWSRGIVSRGGCRWEPSPRG